MRLVWPGSLSVPKALYYINRYLSISIALYSNYRQYHNLFGWWTLALKDYQKFPTFTHHSPRMWVSFIHPPRPQGTNGLQLSVSLHALISMV